MNKLWKTSVWKCGSQWYVNCIEDQTSNAGKYWIPAKILNISLDTFVQTLIDKFKPSKISFKNDVLIYSWSNYENAREWSLYINKIAKNRNITI